MAGTTKAERITAPPGSDLRQTEIQHNGLVDDVELVRSQSVAQVFSTAGLAIKSASSALAKAATAHRYIVPASGSTTAAPTYGLVAANTDMAALSGTVTNAKFNVFVFSVKDNGTGTQTFKSAMGTEGATRSAVVFPSIAADEAIIGFVEVNPTGTGNFVGGTTALDDATVVPNAVYVNTPFPWIGSRSSKAASALTGAKIGRHDGTALTSSNY